MTFGLENKTTVAKFIVTAGTIVSALGVVAGAFLAWQHQPVETIVAVGAAFTVIGNRLTKIAKLVDPNVEAESEK